MAYFIFLKSLRSLGEFRKNPHVKIPPKSPCANFQSLGVFKNQILFRKEFSPSLSAHPTFRPSLLFSDRFSLPFPLGLGLPAGPAHPHGPAGHLSSSSRTEARRTRRRRRPASRRLHGHPDTSTGREKRPHLIPLHFPPLIGAIPPPPLQSQKSAPSTPPLKLHQAGN
jgi:hypothetical protein